MFQSFTLSHQSSNHPSFPEHNSIRYDSSKPVHNIQVHSDPATGQCIVMWRDVENVFRQAMFAVDISDGSPIMFIVDRAGHTLQPPRIAYRHGKLLGVVTSSSAEALMGSPGAPHGPSMYVESGMDFLKDPPAYDFGNMPSAITVAQTSIGYEPAFLNGAANQPNMFAAHFGTEAQTFPASSFETAYPSVKQHGHHTLTHCASDPELRRRVDELGSKLDNLDRGQSTLRNEVRAQFNEVRTQFQAVRTMTYQLNEYTVPRLFIVLPVDNRTVCGFQNPLSKKFRLFFLCECDDHTNCNGHDQVNRIHLANHPGYDIYRPSEFFKKYGTYVIAVMTAFEVLALVSAVIIPPVASALLVRDLDQIKSGLQSLHQGAEYFTSAAISVMVQKNLDHLGVRNDHGISGCFSTRHGSKLEDTVAIEGVELRSLESFLKTADREQTFGNLYKIVNEHGQVKWVCRAHSGRDQPEEAQKDLMNFVKENGGTYDERTAKLTVELRSESIAKAFYARLLQVQKVKELDVLLRWKISSEDLQAFRDAIRPSSVVSLIFDGQMCGGCTIWNAHNRHKHLPLFELLAEGQLQRVKFKSFQSLFERLYSLSTIKIIPRLETLDMCRMESPMNYPLFLGFIQRCSYLRKLRIAVPSKQCSFVAQCLCVSPSIQELEVDHGEDFFYLDIGATMDAVVTQVKGQGLSWKLLSLLLVGRAGWVLVDFPDRGRPQVSTVLPTLREFILLSPYQSSLSLLDWVESR
ncbi:hypothetical protein BGZ68_008475 [Mortierella alpina]|nr:hypothetical protein BGZ68_008475 [Mortierella alpina]